MENLSIGLGDLGAPAETSATSETSAETSTETGQAEATAPLESPLSTELETEAKPSESSLTDSEITEDEVRQLAEDPRTPAPLRDRLNKGLKYAEKFKTEKLDLETKYNDLQSRLSGFEGKEVMPPDEIERLRASDEKLFKLSSFSAKPEDIDAFLRETNPTVLKDYQNNLVWNALYDDAGKPDMDNWQAVVDRALGQGSADENRVLAEDVIRLAEAMRNGDLTRSDIDLYTGDVEQNAHRRAMQQEQERLKQAGQYHEQQIRATAVGEVTNTIKQEMLAGLLPTVQKFNLAHQPNDPKVATEFKMQLAQELGAMETAMWQTNPRLAEIAKALETVSQPKGQTPEQAAADVRGLLENPQYKRLLAAGISEVRGELEKLFAQKAYHYKLLMMGYEAENSKRLNAREIVKNPNQSENLTTFSEEELKNMSADERNHYAKMQLTQQLRAMQSGADRLGG